MTIFAALSDTTRLRIVELLAEKGELAAGKIAENFPMTRAAVSRHLRSLEDAGFVVVREEAQRRMYQLSPAPFAEIEGWVARYGKFWSAKFDSLRDHVEATR